MDSALKAVRFRNLDEARRVLAQLPDAGDADPFDDDGQEPQGLLSVIPEGLLDDEIFYRLFDGKTGTLVEVEKIEYSGFGPPAEEDDYMGFASRGLAYVLAGQRLPIEIPDCPQGATDLHHLEAQVLDGQHPIDRALVAGALELAENWDFDDLFDRIRSGQLTAKQVDDLLH